MIFWAENNFLNINLQWLVKCNSKTPLISEIWLIIDSIVLKIMPKECKPHERFLKTHDEFVAFYKYIKNQKGNHCANVKQRPPGYK